jgi:TDG/mug DNA glycosylase family protein
VLIVGSLPGEISLRKREYYGNPGNRFWPAMQSLGLVADARGPYVERIAQLHARGVGLWDVALSAARHRSSDASMREVTPNPIPGLAMERGVRAIAFNGATSRALFVRFFPQFDSVALLALPSTSGSNVQWWTRSAEWRSILAYLD